MSEKDFGKIFITNTSETLKNKIKNKKSILKLNPENCINWKYSDRNEFELGNIQELADDIKRNGQIQPILVRKAKKNNTYEVIAGERRWRACTFLKQDVLAIEIGKDDISSFLLQHSENKRKDISPYSKCMSYAKLINDGLITQNKLAQKLGYKKSSFSELMSFSTVPLELWKHVNDISKVSVSTASHIRKIINKNSDLLENLIEISDKIRMGAGKKTIDKYLAFDINSSEKEKNKDQENLFTLTDNSIVFSEKTLSNVTLEEISSEIKKYILNKGV